MSTPYSWHKVTSYYGFLALSPEQVLPDGVFSLHVMAEPLERSTTAWWEITGGLFVRFTTVGRALRRGQFDQPNRNESQGRNP